LELWKLLAQSGRKAIWRIGFPSAALSVGHKLRIAVACALLNSPELTLADDGRRQSRAIASQSGMTTAFIHKAAALWAANIAEHVLPIFEAAMPGDARPRLAIQAARAWAAGTLNMTDARKAAFAAHAAARLAHHLHFAQATAAARAAGHAAATAHVIGHAQHVADYALKAATDPALERQWQIQLVT
jgi:hypothetical protein